MMTNELQGLLPILIPIVVLELILMIVALVKLFKHPEEVKGSMLVWALVIVFFNIIGPVAFLIFGRKR
ncbi:MAG: PLDc N-terminal domain-containing protein [Fusobacteria bacterium]|nr:PLDc N-terminal domain-containing protein [Fusobacteriota bacterium]